MIRGLFKVRRVYKTSRAAKRGNLTLYMVRRAVWPLPVPSKRRGQR